MKITIKGRVLSQKIDTTQLKEIKISVLCDRNALVDFVMLNNDSFSSKISYGDLDISEWFLKDKKKGIATDEYRAEFKSRLLEDLKELCFDTKSDMAISEISLFERAEMINELIHNAA